MPRLSGAITPRPEVEFILSVPLDLMNAMYFAHLAAEVDGIEGWPADVRRRMSRGLLEELDFLYTFPKGQPGLMGTLGDRLFGFRETWTDVPSLIRFVRRLPLGLGEGRARPGIQGLAFHSIYTPTELGERQIPKGVDARSALRAALVEDGIDAEPVLALYDRPAELRERMAKLIELFHEEHYKDDLPRRLPCLERSVASHRGKRPTDVVQLARRLTGRPASCLEDTCSGPFERFFFVPSIDMGPYVSCGVTGQAHGLFYPCEREFAERRTATDDWTQRAARIYKALADEQRLSILRLLHHGEMYAQEIVERTGLHQSVVSRHLSFLKAVGLVSVRRQNNMKFFSLSPEAPAEVGKTLELFGPAGQEEPGRSE